MTDQNNKRTTTTTSTSSSSSTTTRARAREAEINVNVESIRTMYRDAIGSEMTPMCEKQLRRQLENGIPYIFFHYALEETSMAPRPSWRYTQAIITRLVQQGADEDSLFLAVSIRN